MALKPFFRKVPGILRIVACFVSAGVAVYCYVGAYDADPLLQNCGDLFLTLVSLFVLAFFWRSTIDLTERDIQILLSGMATLFMLWLIIRFKFGNETLIWAIIAGVFLAVFVVSFRRKPQEEGSAD